MESQTNRDGRRKRSWIEIAPIGSDPELRLIQPPAHILEPQGLLPIAECQVGEDRGWLVRHKAGHYSLLTPRGTIAALPEHKVEAALYTQKIDPTRPFTLPPPPSEAEIARQCGEMMLAWRERNGLTQQMASLLTDVPLQTWRKWERGERACPYPRLLALALLAFEGTPPSGSHTLTY